jgi:poly-gamma-glutamate synthesis protein (capsule biosynthesis protein)
LGVFLALQAVSVAAPGFTLFRVDPLAMAVPAPPVAPGPGRAGRGIAADLQPETAPSPGAGGPVTLAFVGDVHFEGFLAAGLAEYRSALLDPLADLVAGADVAVANLETAITERGAPEPKEYTFRAPPAALEALRDAGVDAVSMANNHGLDYGVEGLVDSLAAGHTTGLPVVGIGPDDGAAYRPWFTTVHGRRLAVVAATQVLDDPVGWSAGPGQAGLASAKDRPRLLAEVRSARAAADTVVVFLHWGVEGDSCPSTDQQTLADDLVAAGADVIVGGHAHRLQGAGRKGGALVAYGLGNAVFYASGGPSTESGVLEVTVDGRQVLDYRWRPARLVDGVATALEEEEEEEAEAAAARWEALRDCTDLTP